MKGDKKIIAAFNNALIGELTAINQYFLHARMLENWGFTKLGKLEYHAALDEMKHADDLIKRILFLDGIPAVEKLGSINIGKNVEEVIDCDLRLEYKGFKVLKEAVKLSEDLRDYPSRELFLEILKSEEGHIDWLETQKGLIKKVGLKNYIQSQIEMEASLSAPYAESKG